MKWKYYKRTNGDIFRISDGTNEMDKHRIEKYIVNKFYVYELATPEITDIILRDYGWVLLNDDEVFAEMI
jgi:hypothetical protein